jgi:hypothetical protein
MVNLGSGWGVRVNVRPEYGLAGVAVKGHDGYNRDMVIIRFRDEDAKRRALGYLSGRFSFTSWVTGEMAVPEEAISALSREAIAFELEEAPPATPSRSEAIAAHERGESEDPVDAFARLAGVGRDEWLRRVDDHKANRRLEPGA